MIPEEGPDHLVRLAGAEVAVAGGEDVADRRRVREYHEGEAERQADEERLAVTPGAALEEGDVGKGELEALDHRMARRTPGQARRHRQSSSLGLIARSGRAKVIPRSARRVSRPP